MKDAWPSQEQMIAERPDLWGDALQELHDAITRPDDPDSTIVAVEQGVLRRACQRIRELEALTREDAK